MLEDSDDEAGGKVKGGKRKKAKAKAKTKAKAKAKPAGQTASKRDYGEVDTSNDDDDDDDDGDVHTRWRRWTILTGWPWIYSGSCDSVMMDMACMRVRCYMERD